jgi:hypothetical protein
MDVSFLTPSIRLEMAVEIPPDFTEWMEKAARVVEAGVAMEGAPSAYGLTWEYGNRRQEYPGPKTLLSENPLGEMEYLTTQAPHGWIAVNESKMRDAINSRLAAADLDDIEDACLQASMDIYNILQETVPMDSGALSNSLVIVQPHDDLLDDAEAEGEMLNQWSE